MNPINVGAILPLNINEENKTNSCELAEILIKTLFRFFTDEFSIFCIVTPDKQYNEIKNYFSKYRKIQVIPEEEFVVNLNSYDVPGWYKQQIIKLQAGRALGTDFYFCFDADNICLRKFSLSDVIKDKRALMQTISRKSHPKQWWEKSASLLQYKLDLNSPSITMTPAILSNDVVKKLIDRISVHGDWVDVLLNKNNIGWSEYTLYDLYLRENKLFDKYHYTSSDTKIISSLAVWSNRDKIVKPDDAIFTLVQSTLGYDADYINNIFGECYVI